MILPRPAPLSRPSLAVLTARLPDHAVGQDPLPTDGDEDEPPHHVVGLDGDTERAAKAILRGVVETLTGRRPFSQISAVLTPRTTRLVEHLARSHVAHQMRVTSVRLQAPDALVVEASLLLASGGRSYALAARLERRPGRWAVTALEAALTPHGRVPARS